MKPAKPRHDFPLFPHSNGKWAKKVGGKLRYFGKWDDPAGAEKQFLEWEVRRNTHTGGLGLALACNQFLTAKHLALQSGELATHTFADYRRTCQALIEHFGRDKPVQSFTPSDFLSYKQAMAAKRNVNSMGNEIGRVRILFKWLVDTDAIAAAVKFGPEFSKPSKLALRRHRSGQGKRLFTAEQIQLLLDEVGVHMRAMVLLGINCGFGNTDVMRLRTSHVDLKGGWIHYPRPKTEVERSCPLWQETVDALSQSLVRRYKPKEPSELFFITPHGRPWEESASTIAKQISQALKRACVMVGSFYWLRHTFETIGGGTKDQVAVNVIMGHVDSSMASTYREEIAPERLVAVTQHVREWLFKQTPAQDAETT